MYPLKVVSHQRYITVFYSWFFYRPMTRPDAATHSYSNESDFSKLNFFFNSITIDSYKNYFPRYICRCKKKNLSVDCAQNKDCKNMHTLSRNAVAA